MSKTLEEKKEIVADLKEVLSQSLLALVIDYQGLSVAEISDLRKRMRPTGTICKKAKNTLMRIAVEGDSKWQPMTEFLEGSSVFLLVQEDMKSAIKTYQDFQKATKKTELRGGVFDGQALTEADVKALTELPTKEELMARLAGGIKAIPTKLAVGINAVPTKLAVGIKEVPGSLVRAIKAVSEKENSENSEAA
ncbi:50S ribosomal protein L10 [Aetokthonos hydrillicola Thurmond2011]|jgi:large subunit ribosomal protein L10|uniref:Large ribosomal subunit protein uL10 n=1 Tax=Aetokthonos hydrillicola Thurmond2011 TaxID=2712845 RepID=A0AAP5I7J0_9CYAN|nr:50S ribosomal protein L10 [Aetokthonos hydrillicola]MBO3461153.1 50S ribosomal protein L10 [Aetokthonos hydrillicola CCALA 1050]MBW4588636.1 50S ribosomal protein L10 [Aetokthonos hydrillicola CCALA 1050]MDR9896311.1 50S ribosomal protein L10 [Aetokthonos hydrillicola Thurmond2011]